MVKVHGIINFGNLEIGRSDQTLPREERCLATQVI